MAAGGCGGAGATESDRREMVLLVPAPPRRFGSFVRSFGRTVRRSVPLVLKGRRERERERLG